MRVCFCCVCFHFLVLSQEIGREERLRNDLFCVGWDVKPQSIDQSCWRSVVVASWVLLSIGRYGHSHEDMLMMLDGRLFGTVAVAYCTQIIDTIDKYITGQEVVCRKLLSRIVEIRCCFTESTFFKHHEVSKALFCTLYHWKSKGASYIAFAIWFPS